MSSSAQLRIVAIGGGKGLPIVLKGLRSYYSGNGIDGSLIGDSLTAIVDVSNGGRRDFGRELGMLPLENVKNCLLALGEEQTVLKSVLQYQFDETTYGLQGVSMGSLFLGVLGRQVCDFLTTVQLAGNMLKSMGVVLPCTAERVKLGARLRDGRTIIVEDGSSFDHTPVEEVFLLPDKVKALPQALRTVGEADVILIGPGSLYTGIIPSLLPDGLADAVAKSKAKKILIMNLMTQPGQTDGLDALDHVDAIFNHCGYQLFDYVVLNCKRVEIDRPHHSQANSPMPVQYNLNRIIKRGLVPIECQVSCKGDGGRHDSTKLTEAILKIIHKCT